MGTPALDSSSIAAGIAQAVAMDMGEGDQCSIQLVRNDDGTAQMPFPYQPGVLGTLREDQYPRFYAALTDKHNLPVQNFDLADLNAMQNRVDENKVAAIQASDTNNPITVVRLADGKLYIADGHHRAVAALLNGEDTIDGHFKDLSGYSNTLKRGDASKKDWTAAGAVTKLDTDKRLVYGWASVVEENGRPVVDRQGDIIQPEELVKAAHQYITESRAALAMHQGSQIGYAVESIVFTPDVQKSLGIDLGKVGWFICMKITDDATWEKFKSGELKAFSIGGQANVEEVDVNG